MKNNLLSKIGGGLSRMTLKAKKHSPEILIAVGVAGTVVSAVMACKATTKVSEILEETKEQVDNVHTCAEDVQISDKYSEEDAKKDLAIIYVQTGVKFIKLYAPSVILGGLSLASIITSHNIMRQRNVALMAAYAAVDKGFKDYRKRVIERYGEDADYELKHDVVIEKETHTKDGIRREEVTITNAPHNSTQDHSIYARIFDESCPDWQRDSFHNLSFLRAQQAYFNNVLSTRGYVFLNEVYKALGFSYSKPGQIVGWVYDPENPDIDNYIDFGLYRTDNQAVRNFINGDEYSIFLDFNVQGVIYDLI